MRFFVLFHAQKSHLLTKIGLRGGGAGGEEQVEGGRLKAEGGEEPSPPASLKTQRTQRNDGAEKMGLPQRTQRKNIIYRFAMVKNTGRPSIF